MTAKRSSKFCEGRSSLCARAQIHVDRLDGFADLDALNAEYSDRAKRDFIGFGKGSSELQTHVEGNLVARVTPPLDHAC